MTRVSRNILSRDRAHIRKDVVDGLVWGTIAACDARYVERMEAVRIMRKAGATVPNIAYLMQTTQRAVYRYSAAVRAAAVAVADWR
jgi:hypothetical protein